MSPGSKVLQNDEFTTDLFRFLQLLCEGHNNGRYMLFHTPEIKFELHVSKQHRFRGMVIFFLSVLLLICIIIVFSLIVLSVLDFQNFLRTQTGNTTTVNIIISTVDYLLRLQVWDCYRGIQKIYISYFHSCCTLYLMYLFFLC